MIISKLNSIQNLSQQLAEVRQQRTWYQITHFQKFSTWLVVSVAAYIKSLPGLQMTENTSFHFSTQLKRIWGPNCDKGLQPMLVYPKAHALLWKNHQSKCRLDKHILFFQWIISSKKFMLTFSQFAMAKNTKVQTTTSSRIFMLTDLSATLLFKSTLS